MSIKWRLNFEKFLVAALPRAIYRGIGFLYGFLPSHKSYSQYGEDLIIWNYFVRAGIQKGCYLDIGAFHPRWISNTHLLHKKGWTGTVVDIDEDKMTSFRIMRRGRIQTICAAISNEPHLESQWIYRFDRLWSEIDTLSESTAMEYKIKTGFSFKRQTVKTLSMKELWSRMGKIHFLNIDIEGLDEVILLSLDFKINSPEVIVFENNKDWGGSPGVIQHLINAGYIHLFTSQGSVAYCRPIH